MTYTDYALRCTEQDKPHLVTLGMVLGVLQVNAEQDPQTGQITSQVVGAPGSAWDEIGAIERAPGYWHANLRTTVDLAARAAELGVDASGLSRWFVTGADGRPTQPSQPERVWF